MAAYNDTMGWQHKQYLGRGEFTLEFGDYLVRLTVPNDHVVSATGVLQNPDQVLTAAQRERLKTAANAKKPVFIVTPDEAKAAQAGKPTAPRPGSSRPKTSATSPSPRPANSSGTPWALRITPRPIPSSR